MLVKQELINKIRDHFGLNIYETKVWLALLQKGVASAGEIAEISRVPRSRTYDVLETLEKKGFAIVKIGKPVKYIGVKPQVMLERLKNNIRSEARDRMNSLLKVKETEEFLKLEELYKEGVNPVKREDVSVALKGKTNISSYLKEIIQNAKKEVIMCTHIQDLMSKPNLFRKTFEFLKKEGVKINMALSGDEKTIKQTEKTFDIKIKKINIDAKFFIVDRKEVLFYLSKDNEKDEVAIWLNSDFFAQAFATLFDKAIGK